MCLDKEGPVSAISWTFLTDKSLVVGRHRQCRYWRWDSERELSLQQHRTRTTKYDRLVHKFRKINAVICYLKHRFTKLVK